MTCRELFFEMRAEGTPSGVLRADAASAGRGRRWRENLVFLAALTLASSAPAALVISTTNQTGPLPFTPAWTVPPNSLIARTAPSSALGNFSLEAPGRNANSLTAGGSLTIAQIAGTAGTTASTNYVPGGHGSGAGAVLIYPLPALP